MGSKRYVMIIDLQACTGCQTCVVACKQENNLPEGVMWAQVVGVDANGDESPGGEYPQVQFEYMPLTCQHCSNGPCVEVCPTSATYLQPEVGVVMQDPSLCIGCRYCMIVCPYTIVRVFSDLQLHYALPYPTGSNPMIHRAKTVEKCTFCAHRLAQGLAPACAEACPTRAMTFGDLNDPESAVARLIRTRPHFQLLTEKGTQPSVYYLT